MPVRIDFKDTEKRQTFLLDSCCRAAQSGRYLEKSEHTILTQQLQLN